MKRRTGKLASILLAVLLAFAFLATPAAAQTQKPEKRLLPADFDLSLVAAKARDYRLGKMKDVRDALASMPFMQERVRVLVGLEEPAAKGTRRSEGQVVASQRAIIDRVRAITGGDVLNSFGYLVNGFSVMAKRADLVKIREIPGVKSVEEVLLFKPDMINAVDMTHASDVWADYGIKGEGMLVSIIDTGIDYTHKDMRISDPSTGVLNASRVSDLIHQNGLAGKFFTDKVVYGYNYADKNQDIVDHALSGRPGDAENVSMHGMHVAGITAGNATDADLAEGNGIRGVAPEAQLLAMKVFSNHQNGGAWGDDILMAIQDSVKLGADVINMSLGSPCGFSDEDSVFSRGVQVASEAGTLLVLSAGNEGLAYDPAGGSNNFMGFLLSAISGGALQGVDSGSVGSSSTLPSVLSVASVNNTKSLLSSITYTAGDDDDPVSFPVDEQKEPSGGRTFKDGTPVLLLDFMLGVETRTVPSPTPGGEPIEIVTKNYYEELAGQIPAAGTDWYAFVQRGSSSFRKKAEYAAAAGAKGILIWDNHPTEGHLGMSGVEESGISSYFVWKTYGDQIKAEFVAGKTVMVNTKTEQDWFAAADDAQPSSFTGWGPSPELNFKPEIAAVGGSVYSTLNGDSYGLMSGTSMSAPHAAGASALVAQAMKNDPALKTISGLDRTVYIKRVLSNTACELVDHAHEDAIHSPRRVGAGLINIRDAIASKVTVYHNGAGNIALKDFTGEKTFELTFENHGDTEVRYMLQEPEIYTGNHVRAAYDVVVPDAAITTSVDNFVIPAHSTKTVSFKVNPGSIEKNYIEGYLKFVADEAPALSIPFMGYVGDWGSDLQIFDFVEGNGPAPVGGQSLYNLVMPTLPIPNLSHIFSATQLYFNNSIVEMETPAGNWYDWLFGADFDPATVGFNNDKDADPDEVIKQLTPRIGAFRNVKDVECFITDADGNFVRQVGVVESLRKPALTYLSRLRRPLPMAYDCDWDGMLYNEKNGEFLFAEEGQYFYNIRARRDENSEWQTIQVPVKIDNTKPGVTSPYGSSADFIPYDLNAAEVTFTYTGATDGDGTGIDPSACVVALLDFSGGGMYPDISIPDQSCELDDEGNLTFTMENPYNKIGDTEPMALILIGDYVGNVHKRIALLSASESNMVRSVKYNGAGWTAVADDFITYNAKECDENNITEGTGRIKVMKSGGAVVKATVNGAATTPFGDSNIVTHVLPDVVDGVPVDLVIKGLDGGGSEICNATGKLLVDKTAPDLAFTDGTVVQQNSDGLPYINPAASVTVKVTDNYAAGTNKVIGFNGKEMFSSAVNPDGTLEIPVFAEGTPVVLIPVDQLGNMGTRIAFFVLEEGQNPDDLEVPDIPEPDDPLAAELTITTPGFELALDSGYAFFHMDPGAESYTAMLEGTYKNVTGLTIDGETVNLMGDGTWSHEVTLSEGITYINVQYSDNFTPPQGAKLYNSKIRVYCDGKVPNLQFTTDPEAVPGTFVFPDGTPDPEALSGNQEPLVIWTNKDKLDVIITGSAWDNTFGYKLTINGDVVLDHYDLEGTGEEANKKEFEYLVKEAKPLDFIRLEIRDLADFESPDALLQKIQIRADVTKPVLTPYYDKTADADPKQELERDSTFEVEDKVVLSAEATDEDGGSGLAGAPEIIVNGRPYDGNPLEPGVYGVVFRVKDRAGNETIVYRTIVVNGDPEFNVVPATEEIYGEDAASYDPMKGVTVADPVDGDLTDAVTVECDMPEAFAKGIPGTYTFTYTVTNSAGRTVTATRTVRILGKPEIFGVTDKTITEGDAFDPKTGVTAKDNEDGDLTDKINVEGVVDTTKPGTYTLTYHVYDSDGNPATASCKVTVVKKAPDPTLPVDHVMIEGNNASWKKGTSSGLAFKSNGVFDKFTKVLVDGKVLDPVNYTAVAGSIGITLKSSYLETLSVGKHTIGIVDTAGEGGAERTANGNFSVTSGNPGVPSTGEAILAFPYGVLFVFAAAACVVCVVVLRRRKGEER